MAKLTLYHAVPSRSMVTRWMLEEVGEPYDVHLLSLAKGDNRAADHLAINPMGKVPALRHGDVVITENAAICTYLADAFPQAGLSVPIGDPRRGIYLKWLFFGPSCIEPAMTDRAYPRKEEPRRGALGYGDFETTMDVTAKGVCGGTLPDGRAVHRRRCRGRLDLALGPVVQAPAGASRIRGVCRPAQRARRAQAGGGEGQGADAGARAGVVKQTLRSRAILVSFGHILFTVRSRGSGSPVLRDGNAWPWVPAFEYVKQ